MFFEPPQFPGVMGILGGLVFDTGFEEPPGGKNNIHV